jgi:1-acyl-sn-glycerol-3-phosphate acyltransferase
VRYLRSALSLLSLAFIILNLLVWCIPIAVLAVVTRLWPGSRRIASSWMNGIYRLAVRIDDWWLNDLLGIRWADPDLKLDRDGTYIIVSNHQSWFDIFPIQSLVCRSGPIIKVLAKRELAYIPILGFIFWAFEFPLLQRRAARIDDEASRRADDRRRIQKACDAIRQSPGAILSYPEGTRATPEKLTRADGAYRHLLPPRAGGFSTIRESLSEATVAVIDITIDYPQTSSFWEVLGGPAQEIKVHATVWRSDSLAGTDAAAWLNERWSEKDMLLQRWRQGADAPTTCGQCNPRI